MPLLSRKQAAAMLGVSTSTLDRLTRKGVVPAVKIGSRTVRYEPGALQQCLTPKPSARA